MNISEAQHFWPTPRPLDAAVIEYNFGLKLIGASLFFKDKLTRDNCKEFLGFKKYNIQVSRDSSELKLIKRMQKATNTTWLLNMLLSASLSEKLIKMYKNDISISIKEAENLIDKIFCELDCKSPTSNKNRLNWIKTISTLGQLASQKANSNT